MELLPEYQSAAFVSNGVLESSAIGLGQRFDHYDDFTSEEVHWPGTDPTFERFAGATTDAVLDWLESSRDPQRPLLLWVHYMDPHGPYAPPDPWEGHFEHEGLRPVEPQRIKPYQRDATVKDALDYVDRYDEEIAYADAEIGRLLEGFAQVSELERAMIVLTADHGEVMMERRVWFRHRYHVFEEIIRVPLLIRGPGMSPGRRTTAVSVIDLVPTILSHAGERIPKDLPGRDLHAREAHVDRVLFAEATTEKGQWRAAIQGGAKFVEFFAIGEREPTRRAAFDLALDPEEQRPVRGPQDHPVSEALRALGERDPDPGGLPVSNPLPGRRLSGPKTAPGPDKRGRAMLRALGYLEDESPETLEDTPSGKSPVEPDPEAD